MGYEIDPIDCKLSHIHVRGNVIRTLRDIVTDLQRGRYTGARIQITITQADGSKPLDQFLQVRTDGTEWLVHAALRFIEAAEDIPLPPDLETKLTELAHAMGLQRIADARRVLRQWMRMNLQRVCPGYRGDDV